MQPLLQYKGNNALRPCCSATYHCQLQNKMSVAQKCFLKICRQQKETDVCHHVKWPVLYCNNATSPVV
jgi:hypothetical protein